jgi:hypothetical protein
LGNFWKARHEDRRMDIYPLLFPVREIYGGNVTPAKILSSKK